MRKTSTNQKVRDELRMLRSDGAIIPLGYDVKSEELIFACRVVHATNFPSLDVAATPSKWQSSPDLGAEFSLHELCHAALLVKLRGTRTSSIGGVLAAASTIESDGHEIATVALQALVAAWLPWDHVDVSMALSAGQLSVLRARSGSLVLASLHDSRLRETALDLAQCLNEEIFVQRERS